MDKLHLSLGMNSYDIKFSESFDGLIKSLEEINAPKKLLVVTDTNVKELYANEVCAMLIGAGYDACVYAFKAGEENKNIESVMGILKACVEHGMDRKSMIIAVGGGVCGDMAGFAASIFMRGIRFVQIPTTLLAQSDSSVGGKTGIDFCGGKNIVGAFHQPRLVYINVNTLKTLSREQLISGMGEVIKHGIIRDSGFFMFLKNNSELVKSLNPYTLIKMARINCEIKAKVVEQDEREAGLRAILNFGHTIGHAAESAYDFKMTHGACVGLGMIGAARIAYGRKMIGAATLGEIEEILDLYGFETRIKLDNPDRIYEFMMKDKKRVDGVLKFVLPTKIGEVTTVTDVTKDEIYEAIKYIAK